MSHLNNEHQRQCRVNELQRRAFLVRQSAKQAHLWQNGIDHVRLLPELTVEMHLPGAKRSSMQSAHRRYSVALKSAHSKRGLTSHAGLTSSLTRSHTFHDLQSVTSRARTRFEVPAAIDENSTNKQRDDAPAPQRDDSAHSRRQHNPTSASRLPKKPKHLINSVSVPCTAASTESLHTIDRSKTEEPLNLTRSFTTYNTKQLRREVTIAGTSRNRGDYRASNDPRFRRLKTTLVAPEKPIDAVLQLSPSGRKVMEHYGSSLYNYDEFRELLQRLNTQFPARERPEKPADTKATKPPRRHVLTRRFVPGYLPQQEAFVSDESLYTSPSFSDLSSAIFSEAE